ncbi:UNVERIFIED_CONTAM: hypothetical protein Sradi_1273800 [Sesamum radiatum]|uniref:UDENN domain-containing protein n=1 Tax=Sesamum radiatum TaxID=300843 RepID=A0AAW2UP35_SESRA
MFAVMEMDPKDMEDEWSAAASPIEVLQQLSQEAVRLAGEAWQSAYPGGPLVNPSTLEQPRHRRAHSEVVVSSYRRSISSSNFHKWKSQMQKALHWGGRSLRVDSQYSSFNPEVLANQKRQWYQLNSKTMDPDKYKEPTSLFEHFFVVGIHPDAKLEAVEDAFIRKKKWEQEMERTETVDFDMRKRWQPSFPTLDPQVLFMYPPGKKFGLRLKDLAAFCFPGGVKARILERTPSLSELNELVYGQEHLCRDDLSFIFSLKVADNATLYGVCLHVQEVVQRPPSIYGASSPLSQLHASSSRCLVSAPRCYCILTRVPFFELHYEMLNSIIAQERLNRITKFVNEMALADNVPSQPVSKNNNINEKVASPGAESATDWLASAIPVDSAMNLAAAAAGIISDEEASSRWEISSPGSPTTSDISDYSQMRELDKDCSKNVHSFDDYASETSENRSTGGLTPDVGPCIYYRNQSVDCLRSFESLFSPARSMASEEDDEFFYNPDEDPRDHMIMEWARENKNDLLQIICAYHCMHLPERGSEIIFRPLEHLQAIVYRRPPVSSLGLCDKYLDLEIKDSKEASQGMMSFLCTDSVLGHWCVIGEASCCAVPKSGIFVPEVDPGILIVSSFSEWVRNVFSPYRVSYRPWCCLSSLLFVHLNGRVFLPILPGKMVDFLDAPVPFIVGIQHKLPDLKMRTSNLVRVNIPKTKVKTCILPLLPKRKELISELRPLHSILSREASVAQRHPVYKCNEVQADAAAQFLSVMNRYLESLCADLRLHTITSVQSNNDKVSILLKDSFIDSFPAKDQPFIKDYKDLI